MVEISTAEAALIEGFAKKFIFFGQATAGKTGFLHKPFWPKPNPTMGYIIRSEFFHENPTKGCASCAPHLEETL